MEEPYEKFLEKEEEESRKDTKYHITPSTSLVEKRILKERLRHFELSFLI